MKKITWGLLLIMVFTWGCSKKEEAVEKGESPPAGKEEVMEETGSKDSKWKEPAEAKVDITKRYTATLKTTKGEIRVDLFPKEAPLSVTNFMQLAEKGFYKGLTFHRVVPGFVIQGGDPSGTGAGGPGYTLPAEIKKEHKKGALAWARLPETDGTGKPLNPQKRSSGSQFYITLAPQPSLDGGYTVFGQTTEGLDVVEKIEQGDKIEEIVVSVE